ncbi:AMP-binding protein [Gallaecimonas mangrovi]|uniref:AMP-binding protein n=1 Tax=Gallaecimonas mangrovi TaxID=2291597 RepID=UPI0018687E51|nr:AMP-binding protein [Gallaecimonas mangrovi]
MVYSQQQARWIAALTARLDSAAPLFNSPVLSGQEIARLAGGLSQQLAKGQCWLLWDTDVAGFFIGLLACWQAEASAILPANGQEQSLAMVQVDGIISSQNIASRQRRLNPFDHPGPGCYPPLGPIQLFTSGSTGEPKSVAKEASQLLAEIQVLDQQFGPLEGELLATVSHQHIYGLLFRLLWPVFSGAVISRQVLHYPEQLDAIGQRQSGPFVLVASPAHLARLPEPSMLAAIKGKLSAVFSSGGLLSAEGAADCLQCFDVAPIEVFGSTETGGVAWRCQQRSEQWQPFAGVDCSLDSEGVLVVHSIVSGAPVVMGDKVAFADDGRFMLQGRRDRIVKVEQKRLSLDAMENALARHCYVQSGKCLLLSGRRQQLGAVLLLSSKGENALAELGKHRFVQQLRQSLLTEFEPVVLPRRWRIVASFPVNSQGKLTQQALSALFEE